MSGTTHTQFDTDPTQSLVADLAGSGLPTIDGLWCVAGDSDCSAAWLLPSDHRFESSDRVGWLGFGRAIYICGPLLPHFVQTIKMATTLNISKKRKFVADGVFYSEVNEVIQVTVDRFGCSLTGLGG